MMLAVMMVMAVRSIATVVIIVIVAATTGIGGVGIVVWGGLGMMMMASCHVYLDFVPMSMQYSN